MKIEIKPNDQSRVGEVIRRSNWDIKDRIALTYVGSEIVVGINLRGKEIVAERLSPWELYEEPKEEDANIPNSFIPGICPDGKLTESYSSYHNPKTSEESSVKCEHESIFKGPYGCTACTEKETRDKFTVKDEHIHFSKKNPKLLSPALIRTMTGQYKITPELYDAIPTGYMDANGFPARKVIWPALDANGKPIQYLVEEE